MMALIEMSNLAGPGGSNTLTAKCQVSGRDMQLSVFSVEHTLKWPAAENPRGALKLAARLIVTSRGIWTRHFPTHENGGPSQTPHNERHRL